MEFRIKSLLMWTTVVKQSKFDNFVMEPVVIEDVNPIVVELVGEESVGDKELAEEDDGNEDLQSYVQLVGFPNRNVSGCQ